MEKNIKELVNNLEKTEKFKKTKEIDIILDGGAYSGSYLIGSLFYLKELEKRNMIKIKRFSGCSIGSLLSIIYKLDLLEIQHIVYKLIRMNLSSPNMKFYFKIVKILKETSPKNFYKKCNNNVFITYHDVKKNKQIVKKKYKNNNDLFETISKSSFLPYIMNGKILYKNNYFDGMYPYIFEKKENRDTIFFNLCNQYLIGMLFIRNEENNSERILTGILNCHNYFFYNYSYANVIDVHSNNITSNMHYIWFNYRTIMSYFVFIIISLYSKYKNRNDSILLSNTLEKFIKYMIKLLFVYNNS
tara:strand:- start:103 stop:1005 length:903 start_codon:yes stop_codon:yes gene_type:complete